jgi:hypothetical protein
MSLCNGCSTAYGRTMTIEERIRGLEDAVINLSNILEADERHEMAVNPTIRQQGAELYRWMDSVRAHRGLS